MANWANVYKTTEVEPDFFEYLKELEEVISEEDQMDTKRLQEVLDKGASLTTTFSEVATAILTLATQTNQALAELQVTINELKEGMTVDEQESQE